MIQKSRILHKQLILKLKTVFKLEKKYLYFLKFN